MTTTIEKMTAIYGLNRIAGIALLLLAIVIGTTAMNQAFVDAQNLSNLLRWTGMLGILALGVGFVIVTGGIDLSIGSVVALSGIVLMQLMQSPDMNPWLAILITLGVGVGIGTVHGLLIGYCNLQPFIVTLCGLMGYRGIARLISDDRTLSLSSDGQQQIGFLANAAPMSIPVPLIDLIAPSGQGNFISWVAVPTPMLILLVLAALSAVLLHKTVAGRYLLAMGQNAEAARFSGINTKKMTVLAYVICSTLAAMGGILFALYINTVQPSSMGNFYELYAIAAAVLGGCSLRGGSASIAGIVLGTAVMRSLYNAINLLGLAAYWEYLIIGGVLLIGVMIDELGRSTLTRLQTRRRRKRLESNGVKPPSQQQSGSNRSG